MLVTEVGIVIVESSVHPENARFLIVVMVSGISTLVIPHDIKADGPICVTM